MGLSSDCVTGARAGVGTKAAVVAAGATATAGEGAVAADAWIACGTTAAGSGSAAAGASSVTDSLTSNCCNISMACCVDICIWFGLESGVVAAAPPFVTVIAVGPVAVDPLFAPLPGTLRSLSDGFGICRYISSWGSFA